MALRSADSESGIGWDIILELEALHQEDPHD